ncbi:hypothetical protein EPO15_08920 [bacterium]|nr:MAG: hypothetical protein EPO15_08920 [bacterium]
MARYGHPRQKPEEPASLWTLALSFGAIAVFGRTVLTGYLYTAGPTLRGAVQAVGSLLALYAAALGGAMGEPLPEDPRGGFVPLRLRLSWGILGLTPPPSGTLRKTGAAAATALYLSPFDGLGWYSTAAAAATLYTAFKERTAKKTLAMELTDLGYMLGLAAMGLGALVQTMSHTPGKAWSGLAALTVLALLAGQRAREVCAARWAQMRPDLPPPPALDLSRYELSVERKAAERPTLRADVEEQLVDTGSFRVDAARMLDKLRGYQLSDPRDFVCAWLRCAAASGAKTIRLTTRPTGLELAFDGRPFTAAQLSQPYQALVDADGTDGKRGRHFAYGLLALYRLRPRSVSVTSRGEGGVAAMNAGAGKAPDPESAPEGSVISVTWPAWALYWRPTLLALRARERYGLGPAEFFIDGKAVPDSPRAPNWHTAEKKGWRTCRIVGGEGRGRVRVYVLGTLVEVLGPEDAEVEAWMAHDGLELNISQSSVVRGKRLDEGLDLVAREFK